MDRMKIGTKVRFVMGRGVVEATITEINGDKQTGKFLKEGDIALCEWERLYPVRADKHPWPKVASVHKRAELLRRAS